MNPINKIEIGKTIACIYLDPNSSAVEAERIDYFIVVKEIDLEELQKTIDISKMSDVTTYLLKENYIKFSPDVIPLQ